MVSHTQICPCEYKEKEIVHTVRFKGQVIVIDHIPAEVCTICGDVLLKPETVQHIEDILEARSKPNEMVPLFEY